LSEKMDSIEEDWKKIEDFVDEMKDQSKKYNGALFLFTEFEIYQAAFYVSKGSQNELICSQFD